MASILGVEVVVCGTRRLARPLALLRSCHFVVWLCSAADYTAILPFNIYPTKQQPVVNQTTVKEQVYRTATSLGLLPRKVAYLYRKGAPARSTTE